MKKKESPSPLARLIGPLSEDAAKAALARRARRRGSLARALSKSGGWPMVNPSRLKRRDRRAGKGGGKGAA